MNHRAISDLFGRQDGLATIGQLHSCGITYPWIRRRIAAGEWVRLGQHVIVLASARRSWWRDVRAAWLEAGSDTAVSHITGGRAHRFDGCDRETEIHLTTCGDVKRTSLPGVHVHRSRLLTTNACVMMSRWHRRGVAGASETLRLLAERVDGRLPRSWFQRLAKRAFAARGIALADEVPVRDPETGRYLADLDLAIEALKIGVECQSWEWHSTRRHARGMPDASAVCDCSGGRSSKCGGPTSTTSTRSSASSCT